MADNVDVTAGSGTTVAADEVTDGTLGTVKVQYVKLMDGTLDGTTKGVIGANGLSVTSAILALESGGNLAGAATSLAIIDDWDETNRCAVNIVSGQAGITAGAGAVAASTPRVTLASDDPGVASLAIIDDWDETNRCAVNLISSQTGITGGAGAVGAACPRVTLATDDQTAANLNNALKGEYETVAASQTAQVLGATGAAGDYLAGVLIVPATTSPGNVIILDSATSITIFAGGASSVSNLVPFMVPLGMTSVSGAWKITTGTNVSCIGIGNFT